MPAVRPPKKQKRTKSPRPPATAPLIVARTSFTSLPLEILADVLLYTRSPYTVLAVSRTCSFLYHTLAQNPAASFIWRGVRSTCKPYDLPDPGNRWKKSEADYAAFVFGGGVCEVCQKTTRAMYVSFAARIRLCSSWHCRRKFFKEFLVDVTAKYPTRDYRSLMVPCVENGQSFSRSPGLASAWPNLDNVLVRKTDWEKRQLDIVAYKAAERARARPESTDAQTSLTTEDKCGEGIAERCDAAIQRFPVIMELSAELTDWKAFYDMGYKRIKEQNHAWTTSLAGTEGWDAKDLAASHAYRSLQRRKDLLLENIELDDVLPIRSVIESELLAMQARRERQKAEATYRTKLTEVKKIYERMRCGTMEGINVRTAYPKDLLMLPPLSVFCTLPSVRVLKGSPDPSALSPHSVSEPGDLKSSPLATSLIVSDIHAWFIPVQAHLMRLLGYPNGWQSASTRALSPVKRVTARFFCRRCGEGKVGRGYQRLLCLDLKGVCSHVCVAPQRKDEGPPEGVENKVTSEGDVQERERKRSGKKYGAKTLDWTVDVFETDKKAIRLIQTMLELRQCSEEQASTAWTLNALGDTIRCKTCGGWIVMDFETAIGHAHRHERMEVELVSTPLPRRVLFKKDAVAICAPGPTFPISRLAFQRGVSELLLGPSHRARILCNKANYGCKHCFLYTAAGDAIGVGPRVEKDGGRAMTFHGLRSHIKEKHGIQNIRDEDVFCYSPIQIQNGNG